MDVIKVISALFWVLWLQLKQDKILDNTKNNNTSNNNNSNNKLNVKMHLP